MTKTSQPDEHYLEILKKQVKDLESRVTRLENQKESIPSIKVGQTQEAGIEGTKSEIPELTNGLQHDAIESRIGEHGMAWLGNIVLLFGIIFLMQLLSSQGMKLIPALFGYVAVAGVYLMGYGFRKSYPVMSNLFIYNGHILLYFATLRLHFIGTDPLITNKAVGLSLVLLVIIPLVYLSYRKRVQVLAGIALIMALLLAIFSNSTHEMLSLMLIFAGISLFFTIRFGWWTVLILSIFLVYSTYLLWLLNNPFITHTLEAVTMHHGSHYYLFGFAFIYSMLALLKESGKITERLVNISIIINGLGFSVTIALVILTFFKEDFKFILGLISAFALGYSVILRWREDWKLASALYALYGFVVLSVTVSVIYKFPNAFLLLSIQSLAVVSMALWFRSKFIVIMNVTLFIGLLIAYLVFDKSIHSINFAFAGVALVTARVMNWKKKRLEIQTELIRNIYLFIGFIMTLISLYHAVPDRYVTLSWTLCGVLFFVLSILLSNVKYRWMAIATMVVTAFHLFLFDLKIIGIGYRVIALMFLAIIALGISVFYSRRTKDKKGPHA